MKSKQILLVIVALLVVGGLSWYAGARSKKITDTPSDTTQTGDQTQAPTAFTIRQEVIKEASENPPYVINAKFPVFTIPDSASVEKGINDSIRALVDNDVNGFKEQLRDVIVYPGERSEFGMQYKVVMATSSLVSVEFNNYYYSAGAAHPNGFFESFNYDLAANRQLGLADLFRKNSDYLQALADYSTRILLEKFGRDEGMEESIRTGAAPRAYNYEVVLIAEDGLHVWFNSYQIGPYALGPQEVVVPYSALKDVIDPQGPLKRLTSSQ